MTAPSDTPVSQAPASTAPTTGTGSEAGDTPPPTNPETGAEQPPDAGGNREAAGYRVKLRDAEAQRDALAGKLTALQRQQCEAVAGQLLEVSTDLWDIGRVDPSAFYTDAGLLDETALRAAIGALIDQRPRLAKSTPAAPSQWGQHGTQPPGVPSTSWSQVVDPR